MHKRMLPSWLLLVGLATPALAADDAAEFAKRGPLDKHALFDQRLDELKRRLHVPPKKRGAEEDLPAPRESGDGKTAGKPAR